MAFLGTATDYLRAAVLQHTLGIAPYTMPPQVFIGLCTAVTSPTPSVPGTEVVAGVGYVRRQGIFALASGRSDLAANTVTIEWSPATLDWGTVAWIEIWDANAAGNRLFWGPLTDPVTGLQITRVVERGDVLRMEAGTLMVQAI